MDVNSTDTTQVASSTRATTPPAVAGLRISPPGRPSPGSPVLLSPLSVGSARLTSHFGNCPGTVYYDSATPRPPSLTAESPRDSKHILVNLFRPLFRGRISIKRLLCKAIHHSVWTMNMRHRWLPEIDDRRLTSGVPPLSHPECV